MEWVTSIKKSIDYMEEHLLEEVSAEKIASEVCISSLKGFKIMTGYSMAEYVVRRLQNSGRKLLDARFSLFPVMNST